MVILNGMYYLCVIIEQKNLARSEDGCWNCWHTVSMSIVLILLFWINYLHSWMTNNLHMYDMHVSICFVQASFMLLVVTMVPLDTASVLLSVTTQRQTPGLLWQICHAGGVEQVSMGNVIYKYIVHVCYPVGKSVNNVFVQWCIIHTIVLCCQCEKYLWYVEI